MSELATSAPSRRVVDYLRNELAPRPGRAAAVARITVCCMLVVVIGMLYQIPLPGYMVYIVFLLGSREVATTTLTGVVAVIAVTLAVLLSLLFYTLDADEPALRLTLMTLSTFAAIFLARTMVLGPVMFLAGYVLVLSQTLIDQIPSLEELTRFVAWLWTIVTVPVAVTILVNLLFGETPGRLARRTAARLLRALAMALRGGAATGLRHAEAEALELIELREKAGKLDHRLSAQHASDSRLIETLAELLMLYRLLPGDTPASACAAIAVSAEACASAIESDWTLPPSAPALDRDAIAAEAGPVVAAMADALVRLQDGIARRPTARELPEKAVKRGLLAPDAFSNPAYTRFALKTTLAVMAAYIIYSGLDWPGISTAITTCFFVALGSLGETIHKASLRMIGAAVGGLLGVFCTVYVVPEMTDIGQLCLLIGAVSALGAWVATGSDLISYAGLQGAFAFFLTVLQGYAPETDLTAPRDRVVGILLGIGLMALVFSLLWPTSAADRARTSMAAALRALAQMLGQRGVAGSRLATLRALAEARRFVTLAAFELRLLPARLWLERTGGISIEALERLTTAGFVVIDQSATTEAARQDDEAIGVWLNACADHVAPSGAPAVPPQPELTPLEIPTSPRQRAAVEARALLRSELKHVLAEPD
jgi:multidrug resistance protein MdtO